ncbi:MAG: YitT family protein [Clostridia bacterium]|nr:YitT family protein [Clostridia bacterium]
MHSISQKKVFTEFVNLLIMLAGAFCLSLAMYMFMLPSKFIPGGVSGLTIIIQTLTGFSASYSMLILNAPLIILAFIFLSREFAIKTTLGIGMTSGFLAIFRTIHMYEFFNPNSVWLSALAGGVIGGIGIGLMVKGGGSSGGTEIVSLLVQKRYIASSMSFIILSINAFIVTLGSILYMTVGGMDLQTGITTIICSFIQVFLGSKCIEFVLNGLKPAVKFEIITNKGEELKTEINSRMHRGVTIVSCEGGYTGDNRDMLICVITRTEISNFKRILKEIDSDAFVYAINTREVIGKGFVKRQ